MVVLAKSRAVNPGRDEPVIMPPRGIWQRWNRQMSLFVFIIGVGALWLAISLLLVFEIQ